ELLVVVQDDLVGEHRQARLEVVVLPVQNAVLLVLRHEGAPQEILALGHRHLPFEFSLITTGNAGTGTVFLGRKLARAPGAFQGFPKGRRWRSRRASSRGRS